MPGRPRQDVVVVRARDRISLVVLRSAKSRESLDPGLYELRKSGAIDASASDGVNRETRTFPP